MRKELAAIALAGGIALGNSGGVSAEAIVRPQVRNGIHELIRPELPDHKLSLKDQQMVAHLVSENLNIGIEPDFSGRMISRLHENTGEYFARLRFPEEQRILYFPDGSREIPRVVFVSTDVMLPDNNPDVDFRRLSNEVYLKLGVDGTLDSPYSAEEFIPADQPEMMEDFMLAYFNIPDDLEAQDWTLYADEPSAIVGTLEDYSLGLNIPNEEYIVEGRFNGDMRIVTAAVVSVLPESPASSPVTK
jgi:hypothetical protein